MGQQTPAMSKEHAEVAIAFSAILKTSRRASGLSQRALAASAHLDESFVVRLEKGVRLPGFETLIALEKGLRLEPGSLTKATVVKLNEQQGVAERSLSSTENPEDDAPEAIEGERLSL